MALGKPSDHDRGSWYFQSYAPHLPAPQEFVLVNRSWYNRVGVERVMGFCTDDGYEEFMQTVLVHLLSRLHYGDKDEAELLVNPDIIFEYQDTYIKKGLIAP